MRKSEEQSAARFVFQHSFFLASAFWPNEIENKVEYFEWGSFYFHSGRARESERERERERERESERERHATELVFWPIRRALSGKRFSFIFLAGFLIANVQKFNEIK